MRFRSLDKHLSARAQQPTAPRLLLLPYASNLADRGLLWLAVAATMSATAGTDGRRAAARAVTSQAAASALTNLAAKHLFDRARPTTAPASTRLPLWRVPSSSSFPSGHAASAAAFVTAIAARRRLLGVSLGAVAVAVSWSRVTTGAHYPSDVVAGSAVGVVVALAVARIIDGQGSANHTVLPPSLR